MLPPLAFSKRVDVGGLPPPPGVTPDFVGRHSDIYKYNIACQVLCYVIVSWSVLARMWIKLFIKPGLKIEDCKDQGLLNRLGKETDLSQIAVYWLGLATSTRGYSRLLEHLLTTAQLSALVTSGIALACKSALS